jgi:hypothetical protein
MSAPAGLSKTVAFHGVLLQAQPVPSWAGITLELSGEYAMIQPVPPGGTMATIRADGPRQNAARCGYRSPAIPRRTGGGSRCFHP